MDHAEIVGDSVAEALPASGHFVSQEGDDRSSQSIAMAISTAWLATTP
jgi:hypothetical protein